MLAAPEPGVVEGVQVGRIGPSDAVAFAAKLHDLPRSQSYALAQAKEATLV